MRQFASSRRRVHLTQGRPPNTLFAIFDAPQSLPAGLFGALLTTVPARFGLGTNWLIFDPLSGRVFGPRMASSRVRHSGRSTGSNGWLTNVCGPAFKQAETDGQIAYPDERSGKQS
jgi:hypothetical protein